MTNSIRKRSTYIWWLAWRSFTAKSSGGTGLSFMTTFSILGVVIGVAALVVVLSVMGGFGAELQRKMLAGEPHLEILSESGVGGFSLESFPLSRFQKIWPEATHVEPFVSSDVVIKRKTFVVSSTIIGIRPEMEGSKLWAFDGAMIEGSLKELNAVQEPKYPLDPNVIRKLPGIILGDQLAAQLGADVGDEITILSPSESKASALSGGTLTRNFVMIARVSTGLFNYDAKWAITQLDEARRFMPEYDESLTEEKYVTGVAMNFANPMAVDRFASRVSELSELKAQTWQMTNKALLFALKLEKFAMGSILMLVVLVAAFSISGTMMMTVFYKRSQISILRAIGMSEREIMKLFLVNGVVVGGTGVTIGMLVGFIGCWIVQASKHLQLPPDFFYLRHLPVKYLPMEYSIICVSALTLTLIASIYPAWSASQQAPTTGLRAE
jgi:lipoprotein-releasing system permease protein